MKPQANALFLGAHPPGRGGGSAVRNRIVVEALRSRFESVDAVAFANSGELALSDPSVSLIHRPAEPSRWRVAKTLPYGGVFFGPERWGRLCGQIEGLINTGNLRQSYDLLWIHQSLMAGAAADAIDADVRVLDIDTVAGPVMRAAARRVTSRSGRLHGLLHAAMAAREERRRWTRFEHLVVASEEERSRLGRWKEKAAVVPNAVAAARNGGAELSSDILFVGSLDNGPNVQAADLLIRTILPRIRSRSRGRPVEALVAGRQPRGSLVQLCEQEDVRLLASPRSLEPAFSGARVFAAPLSYGGGTKLKVIEAMAHGLPMVLSSVAAEGLDLRHGRNAFIHDEPEEFASACTVLLRDAALAERLGSAARDTWSRDHRPEVANASITSLLEQVCAS